MFDLGDRKLVFAALVGSHNYNLARPDSDKDYKVFCFPSFEDLYNGKMYTKNFVSDEYDYLVHDVRRLPEFLFKGNYSFLEVLFSDVVGDYETGMNLFLFLHENRNELVKMNLTNMYNAALGSAYEKRKKLSYVSPSTQTDVLTYGYSRKEAVHAARLYQLLIKYVETEDYQQALKVEGFRKEVLLDLYAGKYSLEEVQNLLDMYKHLAQLTENFYYHSTQPNHKLYEELKSLVKQTVKQELDF